MTARGNKSSDIKCSKIPETTSSAPKGTRNNPVMQSVYTGSYILEYCVAI